MKDSTLDIIGRWGWGIDRGVASMGNYLLTGAGPTLLWVDVTNKARPVVIWDTLVYLSDVAIQDSMGYVLTGSSLKIMDLHKPKTPAIVGEVNLESGYSLAVEGPFVFVKESFPSYSVDCVDVSVPTSPYIRSSVASGILTGPITVSKRNLYVGDPMLSYSPEYVDASNPDSMVVSPVNLPAIMSAECAGDSLLLVNAVALLQIYSITVPGSPELLSSTLMPDSIITSITLRGDTAFIGTGYGKIVSVDITDRRHPTILGTYNPSPPSILSANYLAVEDTALYCSYGNRVVVFSVANPAIVSLLSFVPTGYESMKVFVSSGHAYVTSGFGGLWVVDVSDPTHPRRNGNIQTAGYAYDLVVDSTVAYVSFMFPECDFNHGEGRTGIWAIDITHPDSLRVLDTYLTRSPFAIAKSGSLLFVAHGDVVDCGVPYDTALTILDVSVPSDLRPVGYVMGEYDIREITCRDSIAFVSTADSGMRIYDCRDLSHPRLLSKTLHGAFGVSLSDQRAYVNGIPASFPPFPHDRLYVFDISDLTAPTVIGRVDPEIGNSVMRFESILTQNVLFWADIGKFGAIDVSNPSLPRVVFEETSIEGGGICRVGDTLFVTDERDGLWIYRYRHGIASVPGRKYPVAGAIHLFSNYPNPFNGTTQLRFDAATRQHVRIEVFNTIGQHVRTLFDGMAEQGENRVEFDGNALSSGIYFYKLISDQGTMTGRMVLVK